MYTPKSPEAPSPSLARELALAFALTLVAGVGASVFDWHESLYAMSRRWESLQLDELPIALFVFACCLLLLYARRYRQVQRELAARRRAEAALAAALEQNRELAREHLDAQEAERKHLARELHDELGQYLNAIKLDAVALAQGRERAATAAGARIVSCTDHVYDAVGSMIRRLRPVGLDELGLGAALEHSIDQWRQRLPALRVSLSLDGALDDLGEARDLAIYRVVQEALTNVGRHSRASRVSVAVRRLPASPSHSERVEIMVSDDGVGLVASTGDREHFGLRGMRERMTLLGGDLEVRGEPGHGVTVIAQLPLAEA